MSKMLQAVPPEARVILIGDKDQLASVAAGSAFGDICGRGRRPIFSQSFTRLAKEADILTEINPTDQTAAASGLQDCIVELNKTYRFGKDSGISALMESIKRGDGAGTVDSLRSGAYGDLSWQNICSLEVLQENLAPKVIRSYAAYLKTDDPAEAMRQFNRFAILCAGRKGPLGVEAVNRLVEKILYQKGLIRPETSISGAWYAGRPAMITRNNYALNLFNGDIGLTFSAGHGDGVGLQVLFQGDSEGLRSFSPYRLPDNETAFAMTVHKSQGSEFEHVLLILPQQDSPLLTRELIYTGVTRAKKSLAVWAGEDILRLAVSRTVERTSGLRDLLWGVSSE
jgi:exodeoxyribonuclease V alpha subunit